MEKEYKRLMNIIYIQAQRMWEERETKSTIEVNVNNLLDDEWSTMQAIANSIDVTVSELKEDMIEQLLHKLYY